ncbi:MAG: L,D-transpeptidase [Candidatus Pacebacteria bacterium]|nr:L,D-transpeptidase [Candidatus Paceibacterota bacterium]
MEISKKPKKSPYFLANIALLGIILLICIGYLSNLNKDSKNNLLEDNKNIFSSYENIKNSKDISSVKEINKNIVFENGEYVKIIKSCGVNFTGDCVRARACPSLNCPTVVDLRNDMILKTDGEITTFEGIDWYHIIFDEWVRYPDRTARDWYISSEYLEKIDSYTEKIINEKKISTSTKRIIIKLGEQRLYAYENNIEFMETHISSGLDDLPTPIGTFYIFAKTPSRYMQGPIPGVSDQEYDLPGVPWTMYFTHGGAAIHGTYWHNNFGTQWSHGCINLEPEQAERLYSWTEAGTEVIVEK